MTTANTYANILMPIMGNMGNILYVLLAIVGGSSCDCRCDEYQSDRCRCD